MRLGLTFLMIIPFLLFFVCQKKFRKAPLIISIIIGLCSITLFLQIPFDKAFYGFISKEWFVAQQLSDGLSLYKEIAWLYGPIPPFFNLFSNFLTQTSGPMGYLYSLILLNIIIIGFYGLYVKKESTSPGLLVALSIALNIYTLAGLSVGGSIYLLEVIFFILLLLLDRSNIPRPKKYILQGVVLGMAWLSKPLAPAMALIAFFIVDLLDDSDERFIPSLYRGISLFFVLLGSGLVMCLKGFDLSLVFRSLVPLYFSKYYQTLNMQPLQNYLEVYYASFDLRYIILRIYYYILPFSVLTAIVFALRSRPSKDFRKMALPLFFWILSFCLLWRQFDNHRPFDFLLILPVYLLLKDLEAKKKVIALLILGACLSPSFYLRAGNLTKSIGKSYKKLLGTKISDESYQALDKLFLLSSKYKNLPQLALGYGASFYGVTHQKPLWRHNNHLYSFESEKDVLDLSTHIKKKFLLIDIAPNYDHTGLWHLFGREDFNTEKASFSTSPLKEELFKYLKNNSKLITEERTNNFRYSVFLIE